MSSLLALLLVPTAPVAVLVVLTGVPAVERCLLGARKPAQRRQASDGSDVITSDLDSGDYPCDLATTAGPGELVESVTHGHGPISALALSNAHDVESGIIDTSVLAGPVVRASR